MKVREIINLEHWIDGSGYSHTETYSDSVIELSGLPEEMDWCWWETTDADEDGTDVEIIVLYYAEDDDDLENPLAEYRVWQSDLAAHGGK
jgi:hypothetical protein